MTSNIKELLLKSLNKTWKQEQIIKSIIWKSIVDIFKQKKNLDVNNYIISLKMSWNIVIITTQNPIFNSEIINYEQDILQDIYKKFINIWFKIDNLKFKYK